MFYNKMRILSTGKIIFFLFFDYLQNIVNRCKNKVYNSLKGKIIENINKRQICPADAA